MTTATTLPATCLADYMNTPQDHEPEASDLERDTRTMLVLGGMPLAQAVAEARALARVREPERFTRTAVPTASGQESGLRIAARQFAPPAAAPAPAAKAPAPATSQAQREWAAAQRAKFAPKAAPQSRAELLDYMAVALAMEPAAWIGSAKGRDGIKAAAENYLAREAPGLSPSERSAVAALAAEGVEELGGSAPSASTAPEAPSGRVKGKSPFLALIESGKWSSDGSHKRKAASAPSITPAAGMEPEGTVRNALPEQSFPPPSIMGVGSGMPPRLSLIQRMKAGAVALLGF